MIFASRKKVQVKISTFFQPMKEREKEMNILFTLEVSGLVVCMEEVAL